MIFTWKIERFRDFLLKHFSISQISSDGHSIRIEQTNITKMPLCDPQIRKRLHSRERSFPKQNKRNRSENRFAWKQKKRIFRLFPIEAKQKKSEENKRKVKRNKATVTQGKQNKNVKQNDPNWKRN